MDIGRSRWRRAIERSLHHPFRLVRMGPDAFGLCNAPATFQRLQRCLGGQLVDSTLVYLDDVIIFSPDFPSHLHNLEQVLQVMEKYGLKLRPEKCQLFQKEVKFLGHCVSSKGISPDPEKVSAVQDWAPPTTSLSKAQARAVV